MVVKPETTERWNVRPRSSWSPFFAPMAKPHRPGTILMVLKARFVPETGQTMALSTEEICKKHANLNIDPDKKHKKFFFFYFQMVQHSEQAMNLGPAKPTTG
jgi:hypothetical protein